MLQLPNDVVKMKHLEAMQQNQFYSMAFTIYTQLVQYGFVHQWEQKELVKKSIEAAKVFIETVQEDMKK